MKLGVIGRVRRAGTVSKVVNEAGGLKSVKKQWVWHRSIGSQRTVA